MMPFIYHFICFFVSIRNSIVSNHFIIIIIFIVLNCNELQSIRYWSFNCLFVCFLLECWLFSYFIAIILSSVIWPFLFLLAMYSALSPEGELLNGGHVHIKNCKFQQMHVAHKINHKQFNFVNM